MKNNKNNFGAASPWVAVIIIGATLGVALGVWIASSANTGGFQPLSWDALLFMLLWALLGTLAHELGHLLFGFLTGYKFVYFKLLNTLFYKREGKWTSHSEKSGGALGQCLMQPDFKYTDKMPYFLYNAGGVIINLLLAAVCLAFVFIYGQNDFLITGVIVNAVFLLVNAIPVRSMQNDGYNIASIAKSLNCKKAYYTEMKSTAAMLEGKNFTDMPEEFFCVEATDLKYQSVCSALYIKYCRLASTGKEAQAFELARQLYERREEMPLSHANTFCVEYFNGLVLFADDSVKAAVVYNSFPPPVKNGVLRVSMPFTLIARILVNALSAHDDRQYSADCIIAQKILEISRNAAEAEYLQTMLEKAKQKYNEVMPDPFDI